VKVNENNIKKYNQFKEHYWLSLFSKTLKEDPS